MASSVDAKLLRATKFPPEFNQKVDMQKVNIQVMKKYVLVCLFIICYAIKNLLLPLSTHRHFLMYINANDHHLPIQVDSEQDL